MGTMTFFGQKVLNTQCRVGRCLHKAPIMKWANAMKDSKKKKVAEAQTQPLQQ